MVTVEEAKSLILENSGVLEPVRLPLLEAEGCVLAEDVVSPLGLPLFTNSAMDGFAVRSSDIEYASMGNPVSLRVTGAVRAGEYPDFALGEGEAARIATGAPVPEGADGVVKVEDAEEKGGVVRVRRPVSRGENIRYEGEEIGKGEVALKGGLVLHPASIGLLGELGMTRVEVYRKPRVSLVVTGEELVGLDEELAPGKVRDTNSITLGAALSREKTEVALAERARDEISDVREKLGRALELSDVLVVTGGVSVGEYDYVKRVLGELGVRGVFWRVSQRPGGPLFFGTREEKLVFGLPGNPASSLVCFYEYVRPALRKLMGKKELFLAELEAELVEEVKKKPGKTHFLRGWIEKGGEGYCVRAAGIQGSHMLRSFALSNCLMVIPKDASYLPPRSRVAVHLLPE